MKHDIICRIDSLRNQMKKMGINAIIIPQTDPHQSEYLSNHFQVRRYLSGFTGSAGSLVVTDTGAFLWTDSRYFIQAAAQLEGTGITLMKDGLSTTPSIPAFLAENLAGGSVVGINGWLFSVNETASIREKLTEKGLKLRVDIDPIDEVWKDRPSLPTDEVFIHENKYAGQDAADKIADVLANAQMQGATSAFISALDEIAWILNIRSRDVNCNPVATSFLYLSQQQSTLFILPEKITPDVEKYLAARNVVVAPYNSVAQFLNDLIPSEHVLIVGSRNSDAVREILAERAVVTEISPVAMLKGVKNEIQIEGIREAMIKDGCALVYAFSEIEKKVNNGDKITEVGVAGLLTKYRSEQPLYFDDSFDTIAGYGPHGAIVHYSATDESDVELHPDGLLLIDSGAQYLDGTTDITRTISLGNPTPQQRRDFTLVMKGHIALGTAIFPEGTRGDQLDALARMPLWKEGLSYLHGTGHGVGHFLNVHEGPQSIRLNSVNIPLTPGMVTSNEPGLYRENLHGIRCENLVLTVPAMETEFGKFNRFETLTLFPFDLTLFDTSIMTDEEIKWVNDYHTVVREKLSPRLDDNGKKWLEEKTRELVK